MAAKKVDSKQEAPRDEERRTVPTYLPTANPPKPRYAFLIVMVVVAVIWIGLLAYLALRQIGAVG